MRSQDSIFVLDYLADRHKKMEITTHTYNSLGNPLLVILFEITLFQGFKKLGPAHGIEDGIIRGLSGRI